MIDDADDDFQDEDYASKFQNLDDNNNKMALEVDFEKIKDDEEEVAQRFGFTTSKDKGLADLETGSTLYMTEFLDFVQE